jgi:hypothetical protein
MPEDWNGMEELTGRMATEGKEHPKNKEYRRE